MSAPARRGLEAESTPALFSARWRSAGAGFDARVVLEAVGRLGQSWFIVDDDEGSEEDNGRPHSAR